MFTFRPAKILLSLVVVIAGCERTERLSTERLVFDVSVGTGEHNFQVSQPPNTNRYLIQTSGSAITLEGGSPVQDSIFSPTSLFIQIRQSGSSDLPSTLEASFGYRAETRISLKGGNIIINHTNLASFLAVDSVYAIRGEGIISSGDGIFQNASGLFFEESTYRIDSDSLDVTRIECRYELVVDF